MKKPAKPKLVDMTLDLLKGYDSLRTLKPSSIGSLSTSQVRELHNFLNRDNFTKVGNVPRPECPLKEGQYSIGLYPLYGYKKRMNEYISQFGFEFETLVCVPPSLLEATANYLGDKI